MANQLIAVIDDEPDILELVSLHLKRSNYRVREFAEAEPFYRFLAKELPDLIMLDLMLPDVDGFEICKYLRSQERYSSIPIIMLTAKTEETDKVIGLELGADDYLPKPFSPRELVARMRAVFRRLTLSSEEGGDKSSGRIEIADICVDSASRTAEKDGVSLGLTEVEFAILEQLMRSAGNVVERQMLAEKVLGRRLTYDDRSLDVHMSNLRKKIGNGNEAIRTIRGTGYLYVRPEK